MNKARLLGLTDTEVAVRYKLVKMMKKLLEEGYIKSRYLDRTIQVGNIQKMKRFLDQLNS